MKFMLELQAIIRNPEEKPNILRQQGFLPAVLYGWKQENKVLKLNYSDFEKIYKEVGGSVLFNLKVGDKEGSMVLIKEVQRDPVSGKFIHIDFYTIRQDKPLRLMIPLVFEGEAPAVEELEGYLVKSLQEVEIEALPKDLPRQLKVDISSLKTFEDNLFIRDIVVPSGVEILNDSDDVIASVEAPKTEEEIEKELGEAPEEKVEEVEVVGEEEAEKLEEKPELGE